MTERESNVLGTVKLNPKQLNYPYKAKGTNSNERVKEVYTVIP